MFDIYNVIVSALKNYEFLADNAMNNDFSLVEFQPAYSEKYGTYDKNYENRNRLVNIIKTIRNDLITEDIIKKLFIAEIEKCKNNSLGGFDSTLEVLSAMLWLFNDDGHLDYLFNEAKNANFDCTCGYCAEKEAYSFKTGLDFIKKMSPSDCVDYLYFDMCISENIEQYLDDIEKNYYNDINELGNIKYINSCLGREKNNYRFYSLELENILLSGSDWDISFAYSQVIESIIESDISKAFKHFEKALPYLYKIDEWYIYGLGHAYIKYASIFIEKLPNISDEFQKNWSNYIANYCNDITI